MLWEEQNALVTLCNVQVSNDKSLYSSEVKKLKENWESSTASNEEYLLWHLFWIFPTKTSVRQ